MTKCTINNLHNEVHKLIITMPNLKLTIIEISKSDNLHGCLSR